MKKISIFATLLIFLIPSTLFADEELKTGYDLYHNIKLLDDPQSPEDLMAVAQTVGFLAGF